LELSVSVLWERNISNRLKNLKIFDWVPFGDIKKDLTDERAKENNVNAYYSSDDLIKSGDVDAVLIATPHYAHTPITIAAFEAGLHVISEKPIAVHKADAEKMIAAHAKHPELVFAAMFQVRTNTIFKKIKSMIDNGELGEIYRVNWIITNWFRTQTYYNSGTWRATWKDEGGGVLLNQAPHQLDVFQWMFGMPVKVRAYCKLGKYHDIEVEDIVTAYCEFKEGFSGIFITSTGEAPGTNRLEITSDRGQLVLEKGKIIFDKAEVSINEFLKTTKASFKGPPMETLDVTVEEKGGNHSDIIENFADAILNGAPLIAQGEEGIKSVELANSFLYSSLKDETVELPLDSAKYASLLNELIQNSTFEKPEEVKPVDDISASYNKTK